MSHLFSCRSCHLGVVRNNQVGHYVQLAQLPFLSSTLASDDGWVAEV